MINFDEGSLAAGTIITDQFEGVTISTPSEYGVMIFDTNNPTGEDEDLAAEDLGNVLIISEDGNQADPDDRAEGGTIVLDFEQSSTVTQIGLLDIEESGGFISLYDAEGNLIENVYIEPRGNGVSFELDLPDVEVSRLELNLVGSGALTSLDFESAEPNRDNISSEPIQLTDTGWEQDGQQLGTWSDSSDLVGNSVSRIEAAEGINANTLGGDESIIGVANNDIALSNQEAIITGDGADLLQGSVTGEGDNLVGIFNEFTDTDGQLVFFTGSGEVEQIIDTGEGEDQITGAIEINGNGNFNTGVLSGTLSKIDTGAGNDSLTGSINISGSGDFNDGVRFGSGVEKNSEIIDTGAGNDSLVGSVTIEENGNRNSGVVNISFNNLKTGSGNDEIKGTVEIKRDGDFNSGFSQGEASTNMGDGNDSLIGTVTITGDGSSNRGIIQGLSGIDMGAGDDYLFGAVEVNGSGEDNIGIFNVWGGIRMGAGNDVIVGVGGDFYSGFSADDDDVPGSIDLGEGDDRLAGFGDGQIVDGGTGTDVAEFEFSLDGSVTFSSSDESSIDITANEKTMEFSNVEEFIFAGESVMLEELIDIA